MNAKVEFLETTKDVKVTCAIIGIDKKDYGKNIKWFILPPNYTKKQLNKFLKSIDFEYDAGYGSQQLFGEIFCKNGIWFERGEYDGSEWWEEHKYPNWKKLLKEIKE